MELEAEAEEELEAVELALHLPPAAVPKPQYWEVGLAEELADEVVTTELLGSWGVELEVGPEVGTAMVTM